MSRGNWNVTRAIMSRWTEKQLDRQFKALWPDPDAEDFLALNKDEARATRGDTPHPRPYCVFEQGEPLPLGGASGGDAATICEYLDVPFQLTVYATTQAQCVEFAGKVGQAFDRAALDLQEDKLLDIYRDPDFGRRLDDETWIWVLPYRARIEVSYAGQLS